MPGSGSSALALDIGGYEIFDAHENRTFVFPAGTEISPGAYVIVARYGSQSAFESFWGVTLTTNDIYIDAYSTSGSITLSVNGDEEYDLTDGTNVIDGRTGMIAIGDPTKTIQRKTTTSSAASANSWTKLNWTNATPASGAVGDTTAGLIINEFSSIDSGNIMDTYDFVELYYDAPAPSNPDSDGDGMEDAWELNNFTNLLTAGTNTDYDGDGFLDVYEFHAGTEPTNGQSMLAINYSVMQTASNAVLAWSTVTGKTYRVRRGTNLGGAFLLIASNVAATPPDNIITDAVPPVLNQWYYRIELQQ